MFFLWGLEEVGEKGVSRFAATGRTRGGRAEERQTTPPTTRRLVPRAAPAPIQVGVLYTSRPSERRGGTRGAKGRKGACVVIVVVQRSSPFLPLEKREREGERQPPVALRRAPPNRASPWPACRPGPRTALLSLARAEGQRPGAAIQTSRRRVGRWGATTTTRPTRGACARAPRPHTIRARCLGGEALSKLKEGDFGVLYYF